MEGNPYFRALAAVVAAAAVVLQTAYPDAAWARVAALAVTAYLGALQGAPVARLSGKRLAGRIMTAWKNR